MCAFDFCSLQDPDNIDLQKRFQPFADKKAQ
jgi:hypothetical protein